MHISSLATLASNWLAPRMPLFTKQNPGISFQIKTYRHGPFQLRADECDVAIHYGEPSWPNGLLHRLFYEDVILVCSASYKTSIGLHSATDLQRAVLLQQTTRPDAWIDVLNHLDRKDVNPLRGPRFDLYSMVIEAAVAGLGVGAVPRCLVENYLARDRLIVPIDCSVRSRHAYYVVSPEAKRQVPEVQAFRRWIVTEARKTLSTRND